MACSSSTADGAPPASGSATVPEATLSEMAAMRANRFFRMVNPMKEKLSSPKKKYGTNSSLSSSYLTLKKMNPAVGNRKKRLKARLSLRCRWVWGRLMAICPCFRSSGVHARLGSQKKSHPGAAGEVGLDRTVSILFQNGFFGKFGRPFGPGRWLDIPRRGEY